MQQYQASQMILDYTHQLDHSTSAMNSRMTCPLYTNGLLTIYLQFNAQKFQYVCYHTEDKLFTNNMYIYPSHNIINPVPNVRDIGITMSNSCTFEQHIANVIKTCSQLLGWILRSFSSRDKLTMLTLFKCIILPRLEYGCQVWNPHMLHHINNLEKIQRTFTKHISGLYEISYIERLKSLNLYSLQRRRDRYLIIYVWKILESLVPNLHPPIKISSSNRLGRMCYKMCVPVGHHGTLMFNSFRWQAIRLFNSLPMNIRDISNVDVSVFKTKLDIFLSQLKDEPCQAHEETVLT